MNDKSNTSLEKEIYLVELGQVFGLPFLSSKNDERANSNKNSYDNQSTFVISW